MLDSEEAARRLGIKVPTLYAYVSRGLISARKGLDGRRISFSADEIEARSRRLRRARHVEIRVATVATGISQLHEGGPSYRGVPAAELAAGSSFEEVAELLWRAGPGPWQPADEALKATGMDNLPARDRIRLAVIMAGATDPVRSDLRSEAVVRTGRRLLATVVRAVSPEASSRVSGRSRPDGRRRPHRPRDDEAGMAAALAAYLASATVTPELVRAVNAILVLMADHEIALSTLAVRVAATARSDCYDAALAGLGTVSGPLHGAASDVARRFLEDSEKRGVDRALGDILRWQGSIPGFGHSDYTEGDPRFAVLMPYFEDLASPSARDLVHNVLATTERQGLPLPNVNLAIAAIAFAGRLVPDAGEILFTVARMAGWIAHYLEELEEAPRRFRTRTLYNADS